MKDYDIVIVGGSTTGCYFADKMAKAGFKVLAIEKSSRETVSPEYDVFHMGKSEMEQFGLEIPKPGDADYCFEFEESSNYSAFGNHPKPSKFPVVGMHKHTYILRMADKAIKSGAEIIYEASFSKLLYTDGKISGVTYKTENGEESVSCRLVADCSGIPAVVRRSLPPEYKIEAFELTPNDVFFVVLRYISFADNRPKWLRSESWLYYKTWLAPSDDDGAILGIGSNFGYDYAERMLELFTKNVKLPEFTVRKIERGRTPYHRPPYSFVSDGFITMGDAACLTKPFCGEGCTSSLVQADIAVDVITGVLKSGEYPTREKLWSINKRYIDAQGKEFASLLAMLIGVVRHSPSENEYFFEHDVIFSQKILGGGAGGVSLNALDILKMVFYLLSGTISGKVRSSTVKSIVGAALKSGKITKLYDEFPEAPGGYEEWVKKAEALWNEVGSMSDFKLLE